MNTTAAASYATTLVDVAKSNNTFETTAAGVEKIEKFFASHWSSTFASNPSFVVSKFLALLLYYGRTQLELLVELKDVIA
ncbi:hypothetical protein L3X38_010847 [Prunus dulcis]|uniref:Uncharacterized protein n=1 Tax=Prunus dulcis TaxID=3755 RepID=A0AAD4WGZ7_PRUDU|nr:hypothetical protein L3X38_010847 [Prunus dulcis]